MHVSTASCQCTEIDLLVICILPEADTRHVAARVARANLVESLALIIIIKTETVPSSYSMVVVVLPEKCQYELPRPSCYKRDSAKARAVTLNFRRFIHTRSATLRLQNVGMCLI